MRKTSTRAYWAPIPTEEILLRIQNRAKRLAKLVELNAPPIIVANENAMLQEALTEYLERMKEQGLPVEPVSDDDPPLH